MSLEFRSSFDKRIAGIAGVSAYFSRHEHRDCRRAFRRIRTNRNEKCFQREEKFKQQIYCALRDDQTTLREAVAQTIEDRFARFGTNVTRLALVSTNIRDTNGRNRKFTARGND